MILSGRDADAGFIELTEFSLMLRLHVPSFLALVELFERFQYLLSFNQQLAQTVRLGGAIVELPLRNVSLGDQKRLVPCRVAQPVEVD